MSVSVIFTISILLYIGILIAILIFFPVVFFCIYAVSLIIMVLSFKNAVQVPDDIEI